MIISLNCLRPIPIDNVTTLNLKKLGLTLSSIPSNGEKIILAATSNESRGGTSQDFLSFLHPQNAELCVQATQTLSLNISGVDLISEDASEPWRTNNTIVCEVNSQPQFGDLKHAKSMDMNDNPFLLLKIHVNQRNFIQPIQIHIWS